MEPRPKIKLELSVADQLFEIAGWLALSAIWILVLIEYKNLPDKIPTHFNISGQADGFGHKPTIFILPVIGTVLFAVLSILGRFPHVFNYPVNITEENALRQYTMATRMIRYLKLAIIVIFTGIVWSVNSYQVNKDSKLSLWFLPLTLVIVFVPLIYFIIKSFKEK